MATVSDLIHSSMRLIGAIAAGEELETNELNDALVSLNQMLSSWNTEGASLVARRYLPLNLLTGISAYLLSERPVQIVAASSTISGADSPIELVDAAGIEAVPEKGLLSIYVKKLFCDYGYPTCSIRIWPSPRASGSLLLWILSTIAQFDSLDAVIDLPPGYEAGLRFNLAIILAPEYGRPIDQLVIAGAQNFKASLVQLNSQNQMRSQLQSPAQPIAAPSPAA